MMRVVNSQAWAGENFAYVQGDVIELPDNVAAARIAAGLAEPLEAQRELPLQSAVEPVKIRKTRKG